MKFIGLTGIIGKFILSEMKREIRNGKEDEGWEGVVDL